MKKSSYYTPGTMRVMKDGVPVRMPAWYRDLTSDGKAMIGTSRILSAPYGRGIGFKQEAREEVQQAA